VRAYGARFLSRGVNGGGVRQTMNRQYGQPGGGSILVRPARFAAPVAELPASETGAVTP